jgi:FkbM family methyltransferase
VALSWLTLKKALYCALRPRLWRAMRLGVAPSIEHVETLGTTKLSTLVDIGANRGQFTLLARLLFPDARIFAFEPLSGPADVFRRLFAEDKEVKLYDVAIGNEAGTARMNVMSRDDSSSVLEPESLQGEIFGTDPSSVQAVRIQRLAESLDRSNLVRPALMKIDVQGYELEVLHGSSELLSLFDAILVECSYVRLYKSQPLASDIISWLATKGFALQGVFNQHIDAERGPIQADFLFAKRDIEVS